MVGSRVLAVLVPLADPGVSPNQNGSAGSGGGEADRRRAADVGAGGVRRGPGGVGDHLGAGAPQGNYQHAASGKTGVLVAAGGALLIGGANAIVAFFSGLGAGIS